MLAGFALSLVAPVPSAAQCLASVDTVLVENAGVAGGKAGLADLLHIRTRPSVIRRTVLLRAGDCYDPARVAESERALWGLGVFRAVKVDTVRLPTGRLALRVATADGWSARPVADYARTADRTSWEAGVIDANFLGTAGQLFTSYRSTPDRAWLAASYSTRHVVFPGSFLWVGHSRLSNGRQTAWALGLPFREAAARFSAMLEGEVAQERYLIFGEHTSRRHRVGARSGCAGPWRSRRARRAAATCACGRRSVGAKRAGRPPRPIRISPTPTRRRAPASSSRASATGPRGP